jgi:hypothetical protein
LKGRYVSSRFVRSFRRAQVEISGFRHELNDRIPVGAVHCDLGSDLRWSSKTVWADTHNFEFRTWRRLRQVTHVTCIAFHFYAHWKRSVPGSTCQTEGLHGKERPHEDPQTGPRIQIWGYNIEIIHNSWCDTPYSNPV